MVFESGAPVSSFHPPHSGYLLSKLLGILLLMLNKAYRMCTSLQHPFGAMNLLTHADTYIDLTSRSTTIFRTVYRDGTFLRFSIRRAQI